MTHLIEPATTARARCRGCGERIDKGALRVGERLPNAFGEGEMTLWFHPACAAHKRPEVFLEAVQSRRDVDELERLEGVAKQGIEHRRLPRIDGVQRSPSGRSHCRNCRGLIDKGAWRIRLVYYQEGRFEPSGTIHLSCAREYFEAADVRAPELVDRLRQFSPGLTNEDVEEVRAAIAHPA